MIQRPLTRLAVLILALSPPTFAQKQSSQKPKQPLQTAIRAARLLDVKTGVLINDAVVTDDEIRPRATARMLELKTMLKTASELGITIAAGWDPGDEKDQGTNAGEIVLLTTAGLSNLEALRAATISGAELLDWQDRIGSLETGKLADIVAVPGNPLSDIKQVEHVSFVMKGGVVIKDEHKVGK
jgi:imidazolonepropionase-like amidohydrolase